MRHFHFSALFFAAVQCSALGELENGFVTCEDETEMRFSYEKNCSFSCDAGYRLVGPTGVTCTSAAEWSEKTPHCEGEGTLQV